MTKPAPLPDNVIRALALTAFNSHYTVTRKPGWTDAETHWLRNPAAQTLWIGLIAGIVDAVDGARAVQAATEAGSAVPGALPGLGAPLDVPGAARRHPTPVQAPGLARLAQRAAGSATSGEDEAPAGGFADDDGT